MATPIFANFARTTLASGILNTDPSPVTVNVSAGTGSLFPSPSAGQYFPIVIVNASGQKEVLYCTSRTVDALTCTRAQESTTARTFATGNVVGNRVTQGALADLLNQNSSTTAAETTVAAATTTDPGASQSVAITTGTGTINNFTVYASGTKRFVRATGAFSITTAGNITVPGATTLSVASGDTFWMESIGATWVIGMYQRAAISPTNTLVASVNGGTGTVFVNPGFSNIAVLTGSGNWTIPANVTIAKVTVIGGGGAGAAGGNDADLGILIGTGGGAGATSIKYCTGLTPAGVIAYVVGGAGVASSFAAPGGTITANPGATATSTSNAAFTYLFAVGGAGGVATGGDINVTGQRGTLVYGGSTALGAGGLTSNSTSGAAGTGFGSGGGGGYSSNSGGAGAAGTIIVEY